MKAYWVVLSSLLLSSVASAQSLSDYLTAALKNNPQARISRADLADAESARLEAMSGLLPTITAQANYTHNQYDAKVDFDGTGPIPAITIQAKDQRDANIAGHVALLDGVALYRYRAARAGADAALATQKASDQELLMAVARAYYAAIASQELVQVAERTKSAADENAKIVATRVSAGTATKLFSDRAELEVARDEQLLIDARRSWAVARRSLASLTGLPEPESLPPPPEVPASDTTEDGYQTEAATKRPELAAARETLRQATLLRSGAWVAFAPTITAHGIERYTNAAGFTGNDTSYSVGLTADWTLVDFGTRIAAVRRARSQAMRTSALLEDRQAKVRDEIHSSWLDFDGARAKLAAAKRGADVAKSAADETKTRFQAGTATQLDVIQADRDLLSAEVDRIRAEADLALARLALQRAAGETITP